ncbi:hypothetical protein RB595_002579 [Gaeumannomyces hyphopodioides]
MGTYTFKWPHAGEQVYVTGTFDDWTKSVKLDKVGDVFEKEVTLPDSGEKVYYKFVVDGVWTVNQAAAKENDPNGTENNFLTPDDLVKSAPAETAFINSVGPESTTAALVKDVPVEDKKAEAKDKPKEEPGEEIKDDPKEESSADAIADMAKGDKEAVPGAFPETPAAVLEKEFKVSPLPASEGAVNPIKLAPGEPIPESIIAQDVNANVKLDPESYEKADTLAGVSDVAALLPPVSSTMIPESSLPIAGANDVTISSVGPNATTIALAGEVPLEPKAPAIVKESQEKAGVDPEASAIGGEVKEKAQVEAELLQKVPEAPSTAEGTAGQGTDKAEADKTLAGTVTEAAAGLGAATMTLATVAQGVVEQAGAAAAQLPDSVKQHLPESVQKAIAPTTKEEIRQEVSPEVPAEVKESIKEAGESPEAAANTAAVEEKKEVEAELLKEVQPAAAVGEGSKKADETTAAKPAETAAPAAGAAAEAKPATNGTTTDSGATAAKATAETPAAKPAEGASAPTTPEKKKKNRLSMMLSKIKSKVSSAHK